MKTPILAILKGRYLAIWAVYEKSKFGPNYPQMVWDGFGDVFRLFSAFFFVVSGPFIVKNAYSGHFEGPITKIRHQTHPTPSGGDLGHISIFREKPPRSRDIGLSKWPE